MNEDQLTAEYLQRLESAAAGLPAIQRDALVAQTAARIAEARRTGPQRGTNMASVYLRNFLDQLGDPADLVRQARSRHRTRDRGPRAAAAEQRTPRREGWAVALLLLGGFLAGGGWLAGVTLLWTSPRWRITDKVLGTLIWPGGLAGALAAPAVLLLRQVTTGPTCSMPSSGPISAGMLCPVGTPGTLPGPLFVTLILVLPLLAIGGCALVAARLLRRAREAEAGAVLSHRMPVGSQGLSGLDWPPVRDAVG